MNILQELLITSGVASQKKLKQEGLNVFCKVERKLPLPIKQTNKQQINFFISDVIPTLSKAEKKCLLAHLNDMVEMYETPENHTAFEDQMCCKWRGIYKLYIDALLDHEEGLI